MKNIHLSLLLLLTTLVPLDSATLISKGDGKPLFVGKCEKKLVELWIDLHNMKISIQLVSKAVVYFVDCAWFKINEHIVTWIDERLEISIDDLTNYYRLFANLAVLWLKGTSPLISIRSHVIPGVISNCEVFRETECKLNLPASSHSFISMVEFPSKKSISISDYKKWTGTRPWCLYLGILHDINTRVSLYVDPMSVLQLWLARMGIRVCRTQNKLTWPASPKTLAWANKTKLRHRNDTCNGTFV